MVNRALSFQNSSHQKTSTLIITQHMVERKLEKWKEVIERTYDCEEDEESKAPFFGGLNVNSLPFEKDVAKQQDMQYETSQEFIYGFLNLFETINKLGNPIKFNTLGSCPQMLLVGEMGNGKSTTGNACLKELIQEQNMKFRPKHAFQSSKSAQAVTTKMKMKFFTGLNIMDTPGFNDPKKKRTDKKIMSDILRTIQNDKEIKRNGLAAILQCVMIPQSGRVQKSAIQIMSKLLQIFTLSYPDSDQIGPKFLIMFTNFSKFDGTSGSGDISFDSEDDEELTQASTQGDPQTKDEGSKVVECSLENYIKEFKSNLIDCLAEDQNMQDLSGKQRLTEIVDKLFPDDNFFAFKTQDGFSKERVQQEKTEILRLIKMVRDKKISYRMQNEGQSYLQPILVSNDCRDEMIRNLEKTLQICKEQTSRSIQNYLVHSKGQRSAALDDIDNQISTIEKTFKKTLKAKPYTLQKATSEAFLSVRENIKRFNNVCQVTLEQEISKYSKKEAEKYMREIEERFEKEREQERQNYERICKELEMHKEEVRQRQERRRKNVYNPRFASKTCWGCGVLGHLVYWCPEIYY